MTRTIALAILLAFVLCASAHAGDNPGIQVFLDIEGYPNYIQPDYGQTLEVYVCFQEFEPGGGMESARVHIERDFTAQLQDYECLMPNPVSLGHPETGAGS